MELTYLETFTAVVRAGSIGRAAAGLGYTQSAVSRQIAALEREWGVRLLERRPRGIVPTEHGRVACEHAAAVTRRCAELRSDLVRISAGESGRIRVGAFPTALAALVPTALRDFRAGRPKVAITLTEGRTPQLLHGLAEGELDLAVVSAPPDHGIGDERVDSERLLDEPMVVAVPVDHRLAHRRVVRLRELSAEVFITGSRTGENELLRARMPDDFDPRVDMVVADWTGKLGCVAAGLGVALLPALAVRAAPTDVRLLRVHPDDALARRVSAAWPAGGPTVAAAALVRELRAAATVVGRRT